MTTPDRLARMENDYGNCDCNMCTDCVWGAAEIRRQRDLLASSLALVHKQAEDEGLWFVARTAPEAYLQQELRRLHAAIEGSNVGTP